MATWRAGLGKVLLLRPSDVYLLRTWIQMIQIPRKEGTPEKGLWILISEPRPEPGLDCLICATFARQRIILHLASLPPTSVCRKRFRRLQGYLARKKLPPPRTLQYEYAQGPMAALTGGAVSHERGTPVNATNYTIPLLSERGIT